MSRNWWPKRCADEARQQRVAEAVPAAVGARLLLDAAADHHVEVLPPEHADHLAGTRGVVGAVAIDHHVDVGVDVAEHASNDMTLALPMLAPDDRPRRMGGAAGLVGGVVVVDVDEGRGQLAPEIAHDGLDGGGLVVARDQHRDTRRTTLMLESLGRKILRTGDRCGWRQGQGRVDSHGNPLQIFDAPQLKQASSRLPSSVAFPWKLCLPLDRCVLLGLHG